MPDWLPGCHISRQNFSGQSTWLHCCLLPLSHLCLSLYWSVLAPSPFSNHNSLFRQSYQMQQGMNYVDLMQGHSVHPRLSSIHFRREICRGHCPRQSQPVLTQGPLEAIEPFSGPDLGFMASLSMRQVPRFFSVGQPHSIPQLHPCGPRWLVWWAPHDLTSVSSDAWFSLKHLCTHHKWVLSVSWVFLSR